jgi:nucleoside-diphosphate-sugar epimerase
VKICIAGGAGFIGSRLVPELIKDGHEVKVIDLLWFGNSLPKEAEVVQKDIFNVTEDELAGYDAAIFLAGLSNDPMAEFSPAMNFVANASAPAYFAYIAKRAGVPKFIYAGSCSVYGYTDNQESDETSVAKSNYPYGISKLQGEMAVMKMQEDDFSVIALRQGTVCGYSPRMRLDLILNTMYKAAHVDGKVRVDNPAIWRPILAISDAVKAYQAALAAPAGINGVFNVRSFNMTVGEAGDDLVKHMKENHGKDITQDIHAKEDFRNYCVSNRRAARELGIDFEGSVPSILKELDETVGQDFDFDNDKYYNIRIFKKNLGSEASTWAT